MQENEELEAAVEVPEPSYFDSVNILYVDLKRKNLLLRGVHQTHCGEAHEDSLDFVISTEMAAKSVLSVKEYVLWQVFSFKEAANMLPLELKSILNQAFEPIYYGYYQLRKSSEHASALQRAKELRQAAQKAALIKAADDRAVLDQEALKLFEETAQF